MIDRNFWLPEHKGLRVSFCYHAVSVVNIVPCVRSRGHIFSWILIKLGRNVCLDEILDEFEIGSCGFRSRSLGQVLGKPCVRSKDHFFSPLLMKRGQNVCLDDISEEFENGSFGVKNYVTGSNLTKTLCTL